MDWQKRQTHELLGQIVTVQIDRPIGHCHGDIVYPINYGFVPGMMGGDGEELDAYILGIDEPVTAFTGPVIGVIRRHNDCEDKLVIAPEGQIYHQGEIAAAVHFQERYFISTIDSLFQKSCGVVPFRRNGGEVEFLILFQRGSQSWSFPKGHMEAGETEVQTALRELHEETGLFAILKPESRVSMEYPINMKSRKELVLFLGEVHGNVKLQAGEIEAHRWVPSHELKNYLFADTAAIVGKLISGL